MMMASKNPTFELTPRERQVAHRLLKGEKRSTIGAALGIHIRTVDFHLGNLRRKARAGSLVELAIWCVRLNGEL
jgi:DNA-binding CsgD family transcriptional regulator